MTSLVYTLKLAAERDDLSQSRSVLLNILVGSWALLVAAGQYSQSARGSSLFLVLSLPFFVKALKGGFLDRHGEAILENPKGY